jgi:hypothetical protein
VPVDADGPGVGVRVRRRYNFYEKYKPAEPAAAQTAAAEALTRRFAAGHLAAGQQ